MKTRKTMGVAMALTAAVGLLLPDTARAGRKETETAIKFLTGIAFVEALHQTAVRMPPPAPRIRYEVVHTRTAERRYDAREIHRRPYRGETRRDIHRHRRPYRQPYSEPIIQIINRNTRLMQPRIRGNQAFVQVRCRRTGNWITTGVHPSIW